MPLIQVPGVYTFSSLACGLQEIWLRALYKHVYSPRTDIDGLNLERLLRP